MEMVNPRCVALDVHKTEVKVRLVWRDAQGRRCQQVRTFGTMTKDGLALRQWLQGQGCPVVAMESTGVYWKPLVNLLEGDLKVMLVNPAPLKQGPGRQTEVKDGQWRAQWLEHGLLTGSFIPPAEIRPWRDLTRSRRKRVQARAPDVNRVQKVLEEAKIKLGSGAPDIMGVSGRALLQALLRGVHQKAVRAELATGGRRRKTEALAAALVGRFRPHHARRLARILAPIDFLDESIAQCEAEMETVCRPFAEAVDRLDPMPGVDRRSAPEMMAEIGVDMSHFPSHTHLCWWAGLSPGHNESGGNRKPAPTKKGNRWLRAMLVECGPAAGRRQGTELGAPDRRLAAGKGKKRAAVAVGHSSLEAVSFIIGDEAPYQELGAQSLDELNKAQIIRHHVRRLER